MTLMQLTVETLLITAGISGKVQMERMERMDLKVFQVSLGQMDVRLIFTGHGLTLLMAVMVLVQQIARISVI